MENNINYTATQKENSFYIEFEDSNKSPLEISFKDFEFFAQKYNQSVLSGERLELTEKERIMLSLWGMYMIPNNSIH